MNLKFVCHLWGGVDLKGGFDPLLPRWRDVG